MKPIIMPPDGPEAGTANSIVIFLTIAENFSCVTSAGESEEHYTMRSGRLKTIGTIQGLAEIPFDKGLIVSGSVNKTCWVWRMPGTFKRKGNEVIFENMHGMTSTVDEKINLAIITRVEEKDGTKTLCNKRD